MRISKVSSEMFVLPILSLLNEYRLEADFWRILEVDGGFLSENLRHSLSCDDHAVFVAVKDKEVVGLLWAVTCKQLWSHDLVAKDLCIYVSKWHRDYFTASKLVDLYVSWAKEKGCKVIVSGANSGIDDNRSAEALYKRKGFTPMGTLFTLT